MTISGSYVGRKAGESKMTARAAAAYLLAPRDPAKAAALRERLVAFERSQGLLPVVFYSERLENRRARPRRQRLLARARSGAFDVVCVLRPEHLSRSATRVAQIVLKLGVPVVAANGIVLDTVDPLVRWLAKEHKRLRRRARLAIDQKRQRGERVGQIPFGFQLAPDGVHLLPAPIEQRTIKRAEELLKSGMSYRRIASTLNEEGHRARGGGRITHGQVRRWITRAREKT